MKVYEARHHGPNGSYRVGLYETPDEARAVFGTDRLTREPDACRVTEVDVPVVFVLMRDSGGECSHVAAAVFTTRAAAESAMLPASELFGNAPDQIEIWQLYYT
jgi:hypothetical protein